MFTADELVKQSAECAAGRISVNKFEDWFRAHSRNVHAQDESLRDLSFAIEALFSDRYFEGLEDSDFRLHLAQEVKQFAPPFARSDVYIVRYEIPRYWSTQAAAVVAVISLSMAPQISAQRAQSISTWTAVVGGPSMDTESASSCVQMPVEVAVS
jgi:hypothetical protein